MRRTEVMVAGVAAVGLMFAIIADAAQQRLMRYEPAETPGVAGAVSEQKAEQSWPDVNLNLDDKPLLAYGADGTLSQDAVARIAAIAPAAGETVVNPEVAQLTVSQLAHDAIALVNDPKLTDEARVVKFRQLLARDFDVRLMAKFALGRHWRSATAAQREAYVAAFAEHLLTSYAGQLGASGLSGIEILGTRLAGKRDVMVEARVTRQDGGPAHLLWRLRPRDGQYRIIDIVIEGVSLALTKRQEFAAVIGGGNGLDGLIRRLAAST